MPRTILITGLGTVSALGTGIEPLWQGLLEGNSGLAPISPTPLTAAFDPAGFRSKLGGRVPEFSAKKFVPKHYRKAVKVMARDIQLAVGAAHFAVQDQTVHAGSTEVLYFFKTIRNELTSDNSEPITVRLAVALDQSNTDTNNTRLGMAA